MHNSWGRALIAFHLSARLIFSRWRNVYNFSNARDPLRSPPRAGWGRDPFSCSFLAFCDRRSKKRVHPRFQRREGRSGEANTAGAILLCCRSGDPFLSSNSRRLFFLLSSLLGRRLTPANFQYCPKRCVSRLYFHFPRSSSPTAIIFDPISARTYTGSGIGRARLKIIRRGELYAWINRNFPETGGKFQVVKRVVKRGIDRIVARICFLPTCIISVASNGGGGVRNRERENSEIFRRSLVIYINVLSRVPARVSPSSTHDRNRRGKRTRALIIRSENAPSSRLASLSPPSSLRVYPKRDV